MIRRVLNNVVNVELDVGNVDNEVDMSLKQRPKSQLDIEMPITTSNDFKRRVLRRRTLSLMTPKSSECVVRRRQTSLTTSDNAKTRLKQRRNSQLDAEMPITTSNDVTRLVVKSVVSGQTGVLTSLRTLRRDVSDVNNDKDDIVGDKYDIKP